MEKIYTSYTLNGGFVPKIYKEFKKIKNKQAKTDLLKIWTMDLNEFYKK